MSSPAGLGPGGQGSDGNTTWMFLVPMDMLSTDQAHWSSSFRLAAQFLMHIEQESRWKEPEEPDLSGPKQLCSCVRHRCAAEGSRWGSRVVPRAARRWRGGSCARLPSHAARGCCGRWMEQLGVGEVARAMWKCKKGAAARGEGVNSSLLQLTPEGSSSHCWAPVSVPWFSSPNIPVAQL